MKIFNFFFVSCLILFAYSGMLKWIQTIIDPTIFFGILCVPAIFIWSSFKVYDSRNPLMPSTIFFIIFNLFLILTSLYTISSSYYIFKSFIIFSNIFAFIIPLFVLRNEITFNYFKSGIKLILVLCLLLLIYEYVDNSLTRIRYREDYAIDSVGLPNYLTFSYFLGGCILLLLDSKSKIMIIILFTAFLFMILLAAKGPLLFLVITLIIKYRSNFKLKNIKFIISFLSIPPIIFLLVKFSGIQLFDTLLSRLSFFSGGLEADDSSLARVILLQKGLELISGNFFFGVGIGGYSKAIGDPDGRLSPHNLFIEVWAETGVFLTIYLVALCFLYFRKFQYLIKKYDFVFGHNLIYICLFLFLGNLVSSYLEDMRLTYFWLGVSIAYYSMKLKNISKYQ